MTQAHYSLFRAALIAAFLSIPVLPSISLAADQPAAVTVAAQDRRLEPARHYRPRRRRSAASSEAGRSSVREVGDASRRSPRIPRIPSACS